jgi:molybdopterin molybdotransferase
MIDLDTALHIVLSVEAGLAEETVPIGKALGRVLSRAVVSPIDSPPFDKSAMDGFAVGSDDPSLELAILETIAAGDDPIRPREIQYGECVRIMTGAPLPPGTGRVIRKEFMEEAGGSARFIRPESGDNVVRRGSNLRAGETVLGPKILKAQDIGILAASGIGEVPVAVPPVVGIITTGSEIRAPGEPLGPGDIYDSNGPQLLAQLAATGCPSRFLGVVSDDPAALKEAVSSALARSDILLLTGGVSEGDFDYVPGCLEELGAEILFHRVAVKPGKPTLFARRGERFVFGLPGNPVSAFVIFEVLVKPLIYRRMGIHWEPRELPGRIDQEIRRKSGERDEFLPVQWAGDAVHPLKYHGSAHVNALADAEGLIRIRKGTTTIGKGAEVRVRQL